MLNDIINNFFRIEFEMDEDDDFGSDDDWDEMDDNHLATVDCLFCSNEFHNIDAAVSHCCKDHGLDLSKLKVKGFITLNFTASNQMR